MQLKDLAKAANVSLSTASKALKGSKELHDDTISHVLQVAEEIGYFVEKKKSRINDLKNNGKVIIVVPEIISVYYSSLATRLTEKFREKSIDVQVCFCNFDSELRKSAFLNSLHDEVVSGIIFIDGSRAIPHEIAPDFPTIVSGLGGEIKIDNYIGMLQAVQHLKSLGHKEICFLGEKLTRGAATLFLKAIEEAGLNDSDCKVVSSELRFEEGGYKLVEKLIESNDLPTAFVCGYDELAFGAISALLAHGYKVPEDVSVIGKNDVPAAKYFTVPLATISYDCEQFCSLLVERLELAIKSKAVDKEEIVYTNYINRASVGKAKK